MTKRKFTIPPEVLSGQSSADAQRYATPGEFIRAAGTHTESDGPEGTMCLAAHIKGEHHLKLQIVAQRRRLTLAQLLEEMIDELPDPN
jgi:hypothetical protein